MTTQALELATAGFEDLSDAQMVEVNGGGVWGFLAKCFSWPIVVGALILNTVYDLSGAWEDFWEGFDYVVYGE